ncbi:MAG: S49 family peptidase [Neisseriaceae bacterium]|nr:S49 family peptidase [Neisseriaceae bacterium]
MSQNNPYPSQQPNNLDTWERSVLEKLLMQVYRDQRRERIWRWIRTLLTITLIVLFIAMISGKKSSNNSFYVQRSDSHTAVISLAGIIDSNNDNAAKLIEGLKNAYKNPNVKGIIIRANSPGGSPVISDTAFSEIRRLKSQHKDIPVYVVAEDLCASGCYYIAVSADKIYANPSSIVGSIGVISGGFGATELMEKLGIERRLKTAGENKGMGDPFMPETPEQNAIWQKMLDDIHAQFIAAVKTGRGDKLKWQGNNEVFSGRVYTGTEAKTVGLIDDFGNIYSVSRDEIGAEELVDYTPKDDFSTILGRRFGTQIRSEIKEAFTNRPW